MRLISMLARPSPTAGTGFNEVGKRDPQAHGFATQLLQNLFGPRQPMQPHILRLDSFLALSVDLLIKRLQRILNHERRVISGAPDRLIELGNSVTIHPQSIVAMFGRKLAERRG